MSGYKNEREFNDIIEQALKTSGLNVRRDYLIASGKVVDEDFRFYDPRGNLYADFLLWGAEKAIIECKVKPSAASFARGLGQCLLYKYVSRAKYVILCMPSCYEDINYYTYKPICSQYDIGFATEEDLLRILEKDAASLEVFKHMTEYDKLMESLRRPKRSRYR